MFAAIVKISQHISIQKKICGHKIVLLKKKKIDESISTKIALAPECQRTICTKQTFVTIRNNNSHMSDGARNAKSGGTRPRAKDPLTES